MAGFDQADVKIWPSDREDQTGQASSRPEVVGVFHPVADRQNRSQAIQHVPGPYPLDVLLRHQPERDCPSQKHLLEPLEEQSLIGVDPDTNPLGLPWERPGDRVSRMFHVKRDP